MSIFHGGFFRYLDRYRPKQDIAEEMMRKRFKTMSPFAADPPRRKWPVVELNYEGQDSREFPTWKQKEIRKEQLGVHRYKLIYDPLAPWPNWWKKLVYGTAVNDGNFEKITLFGYSFFLEYLYGRNKCGVQKTCRKSINQPIDQRVNQSKSRLVLSQSINRSINV